VRKWLIFGWHVDCSSEAPATWLPDLMVAPEPGAADNDQRGIEAVVTLSPTTPVSRRIAPPSARIASVFVQRQQVRNGSSAKARDRR
jgi:hypothetical protein